MINIYKYVSTPSLLRCLKYYHHLPKESAECLFKELMDRNLNTYEVSDAK
ncbi:MAG: hypothetical protein RLN62_02685 [Rickettsiales bacterium]